MLLTIGELIKELEKWQEKFGSGAQVGIDDVDTNWDMKISYIEESSRFKGRILIEVVGYQGGIWEDPEEK